MKITNHFFLFSLLAYLFSIGCSPKKDKVASRFEVLSKESTGLNFSNNLQYAPEFNLFRYMYFYNGSGIGAGDFNNDGKIDLFFGSNQGQNTLYLNKGGLTFGDVTKQALIPDDRGWTTGISVVDVNNDGLLDIYICRVGQYETLRSKNQLLINQGLDEDSIPRFADKASDFGLDFSGFSTQAAFLDYDNDGDLDMFLLNHSVHQNNNFRPREAFAGTYDSLSGDRIFRNEGTRFVDATKETGINSTSISYGLGAAVADINLDGYPDLYIGNDFHENDYLYINQKNGTFRDEGAARLMHTSQYSMGVDVADVNNDAHPEIISMDMLPSDPYILKRSLGGDVYDLFHEKLRMGYSHQYSRNNLQYNRGKGLFSEVGLYSGVAATDWSWAPLWMDFDNDGLKDLFISNGIPKRMNDIDYVNFVTSPEVQQKITRNSIKADDISLIDKFPEINIPNKFYRNKGRLSFEDEAAAISGDLPAFSNGAVYADFDNDGDLDIAVNNINSPVLFYENKEANAGEACQLKLNGPEHNRNATGARVIVFTGNETRTYEQNPVKGFLSSMEVPVHIGLKNTSVDSAVVIWPDRTYQRIDIKNGNRLLVVSYKKGLPVFDFSILSTQKNSISHVVDMTAETGIDFLHVENRFVEFDREPLIPHMLSTEGPCMAVADINKDGLDDVFLGGSRNQKSKLYLQLPNGKFNLAPQPALDSDSSYENTDACWADINNDTYPDLVVASGGNEFFGKDTHNTPRVYINNKKGILQKLPSPFGNLFLTASCIAANDFNGDGYTDFFIGGRAVPWAYGQTPQSFLFLNNRNGTFRNATEQYAKELSRIGFVTDAVWADVDNDKDMDLLLSLEWGGIVAMVKEGNTFTKKLLTEKKGWWNFVLPVDVNGDGLLDIVAGNQGLNSRLQPSGAKPVRLYYNDFDANGIKEQVVTYYIGEKELPFATKAELEKQLPGLKKKFLYAEAFAKATLPEILGKEKLAQSQQLTADYFASAVLLNKGNLTFDIHALPWQAQLTAYKDAEVVDANNDQKPDILLAGNYDDNAIEMGRNDADFGTLLINDGKGSFRCESFPGLTVAGQVRKVKPIMINRQKAFMLARNSDSLMVIRFQDRVKE